MPVDVQGTFVSQKINKIRWIPEEYVKTSHFFTGSWDDEDNSIRVWSLEGVTDEEDAEPHLLSEQKVAGDVTEMKFIDANRIAVSTSDGGVSLYEVSVYDKTVPLKLGMKWDSLHQYGNEECSCTSIDTIDSDVASVGDDGKINVLNCISNTVSRTIPEADSCSLHSVCFLTHNEIITGNLRGHMKIWDIRKPENKPTASFLLSGDELAATCIINHPTQPHIVLAGSESGSLAVWDLRMNSFPTSLVNAHSAGVTEMQFHPDNPQKLLTCSVSGELWDWNMEAMTKGAEGSDNKVATWMPLDDNKTNMMVNSLMPNLHKAINSLHCDRDRIMCGADNEAVYLIKNYKY